MTEPPARPRIRTEPKIEIHHGPVLGFVYNDPDPSRSAGIATMTRSKSVEQLTRPNLRLLLRPMAKVRQVGLFSREITERLSIAGVEMLLSMASKLSEGQLSGNAFYGSTMLTLDLRQLGGRVKDACDVATAMRLARLIGSNNAVLDRIRALALEEATRIAGCAIDSAGIDIRVRAEGSWVFIDADVEGCTGSRTGQARQSG